MRISLMIQPSSLHLAVAYAWTFESLSLDQETRVTMVSLCKCYSWLLNPQTPQHRRHLTPSRRFRLSHSSLNSKEDAGGTKSHQRVLFSPKKGPHDRPHSRFKGGVLPQRELPTIALVNPNSIQKKSVPNSSFINK